MEEARKPQTTERKKRGARFAALFPASFSAPFSAPFVASIALHLIVIVGVFVFGPHLPMRALSMMSPLAIAGLEPLAEIEDTAEPEEIIEDPLLEEVLLEPEVEELTVQDWERPPPIEPLLEDPDFEESLRHQIPSSAWLAPVMPQKRIAKASPEPVKAKPKAVADAGFTKPQPVEGENLPPRYPKAAITMRLEGVALIEVQIASDGSVVKAHVARSSGSKLLDRAALIAVRKWRFTACAGVTQVPIVFTLQSRG